VRTILRLVRVCAVLSAASCTKPVTFGPLAESTASSPAIASVDSAKPPRSLDVRLDADAWVVVLLVAPGHSATLLYPSDSLINNRLNAGVHALAFQIPPHLVPLDTAQLSRRRRSRAEPDSAARSRSRNSPGTPAPRLTGDNPAYLLVISAPGRLAWARVIDKTAGVSIPTVDLEALNAVGKAVKSTLTEDTRNWAGYYQQVTLVQP